jgi:hypothetical protein
MRDDWWWRWTVEKPAAFGDQLWLALVVRPAEFLDRLTIRRIVALIPIAILAIAFAHNVPLPPEILFLGDALAYLDVLTFVALLAAFARASAVLYISRNLARRVFQTLATIARRTDFRHRRATDSKRAERIAGRDTTEDEASYGVLITGASMFA